MANVIQDMGYMKRQKKKYGLYTLVLILVMVGIYSIGMIITGNQKNLFTVISAVFTLAVAQLTVRFLVYLPYKDGNPDIGKALEQLPENYAVFHSVLVTDGKGNSYYDHVVISNNRTYCIAPHSIKDHDSNNHSMSRIFEKQGMKGKLHFIQNKDLIHELIESTRELKETRDDMQLQNEMVQIIKQYSL